MNLLLLIVYKCKNMFKSQKDGGFLKIYVNGSENGPSCQNWNTINNIGSNHKIKINNWINKGEIFFIQNNSK